MTQIPKRIKILQKLSIESTAQTLDYEAVSETMNAFNVSDDYQCMRCVSIG